MKLWLTKRLIHLGPNNRKQKWLTSWIFNCQPFFVPEAGVEPAQPCGHWCLRPARLPIPPSGHLLIGKRGMQRYVIFFYYQINGISLPRQQERESRVNREQYPLL